MHSPCVCVAVCSLQCVFTFIITFRPHIGMDYPHLTEEEAEAGRACDLAKHDR